jgi:hypothetical protein
MYSRHFFGNVFDNNDNLIKMSFDIIGHTFTKSLLSTDLWVRMESIDNFFVNHINTDNFKHTKKIIVYDWHDGLPFYPYKLNLLSSLSSQYQIVWLTLNKKQIEIDGVKIVPSDYLWNRTKSAYLNKVTGWKHSGVAEDYALIDINFSQKKTKKFISTNRLLRDYRRELITILESEIGYLSKGTLSSMLESNVTGKKEVFKGITLLPHKKYLEDSYFSFQVESVVEDRRQILYTEKTYDYLIQGMLMFNFGSANFYETLKKENWALFSGIDYSFSNKNGTDVRFKEYIEQIKKLLSMTLDDCHDFYNQNKREIMHNRTMLESKDFDRNWVNLL